MDVLRTTYEQALRVRRLVRKLCCNHIDGKCLLLDEKCVQLISRYGIYCKYFRDAVLPSDKDLQKEILQNNKKGGKK